MENIFLKQVWEWVDPDLQYCINAVAYVVWAYVIGYVIGQVADLLTMFRNNITRLFGLLF